ncbi:MAG: glycosyltransferase family 2 protein [Flavobacteriales bacterium]|nr:glycosyltransferase family 2 protein [Flavobacteriales bacterium]
MNLVSIITPFYNTEKYLSRCIESVLKQSYINIQFILIDDGSTDNGYAIAKKYAIEDTRILLLTQKNQGQSIARNKGISMANGEYLAFLDADDFWEENKLEEQLNFIKEKKLDGCFANFHFINKTGVLQTPKSKFANGHIVEKFDIASSNCILGSCSSIIFRREIINGMQLFEANKYNEDYDLWFRIIFNENKIAYIDKPLLTIDDSRFSSSNNSKKMFLDHYYFIFKHLSLIIEKTNSTKWMQIINVRLTHPLFYVKHAFQYKLIYYTCKSILVCYIWIVKVIRIFSKK